MDANARELIEQGDKLFSKRSGVVSMWQDIGDQFYPERASFTLSRTAGEDFAGHLLTSYPLLCRRDLGNSISGMLRPSDKEWFFTRTTRDDRVDEQGRQWLEYATKVQRRAMYDREALLTRATKEGDHDFATFGQTVLSIELNRARDTLLYRCWHLKDVVWCESVEGKIDTAHRHWKLEARQVVRMWGKKAHTKVKELAEKDPYCEVNVRHIVLPSDYYDDVPGNKKRRMPFTSIYIDVDNQHVMEERGSRSLIYLIPRWQTLSGSPYALSPATVIALPDSRLLQAMTLTILEAGEKAANPPMVATQEAVRSDVDIRAGGITWVDAEYDERLGEALRTISQDKNGLPIGLEMIQDVRQMLGQAFYLNKLSGPMRTDKKEITAFEAGQIVQQYIRDALPLFEPMEMDYNGGLCEDTFGILMHNGAFGPYEDIPRSVRNAEIQFRFESPLSEAIERQKGQKLVETKALLTQIADVDPSAARVVNWKAAYREALDGIRSPASWRFTEEQVAEMEDAAARKQADAELLGTLGAGAEVAKDIGDAAVKFKQAGVAEAPA